MGRKKKQDNTLDATQHILQAIQSNNEVKQPLKTCYGLVLDDPPDEIIQILQQTRMHHLLQIKNIAVDRNLISALVERWRPETHTFHFPYGECTMTLEDVAILFGLPINGQPLMGEIPTSIDHVKALCQELLGLTPDPAYFKKNSLGLDWLKCHFGPNLRRDCIDIDHSQILQWHSRGYILRLLGSILFPDKSKEAVHAKYMTVIQDLGQVHTYSWGSACLSFLYRALCRATRSDCKQIDGALQLLQVWTWYRLPFIAPVPNYRWEFPVAVRWNGARRDADVGRPLSRIGYRKALDQMKPDDFVWQPYLCSRIHSIIPDDVKENLRLSRATIPLLCFEVVEWHAADRVLRQFGLCQHIPTDPQSLGTSHNLDLRRTPAAGTWELEHDYWIRRWNNRHLCIVQGQKLESYTPSQEYWEWYRTHSMSMIVSPEPIPLDPRQCPLPLHKTAIATNVKPQAYPKTSQQSWPNWGASSNVPDTVIRPEPISWSYPTEDSSNNAGPDGGHEVAGEIEEEDGSEEEATEGLAPTDDEDNWSRLSRERAFR